MKKMYSFILFVMIFGVLPVREIKAADICYTDKAAAITVTRSTETKNAGEYTDPALTPAEETDPDSPSSGKTPAEAPKTETIGDKTITTTKYTDGSVGVKTEQKTEDGTEIVSEKVTEKNGSWKQKTTEEAQDGSKTEKLESSDSTGDNTTVRTVKTDKDGNITETEESSKTTDKDGVVTETRTARNSNASIEMKKVTQPNSDFIFTTVMKDSEGNITNSVKKTYEKSETGVITETSEVTTPDEVTSAVTVTQPNEDYNSLIEKKDKEGNLLEKIESGRIANPDNTVTFSQTTTLEDNSKSESSLTLNEGGCGTMTISETSAEGSKETRNYTIDGESAVLDSLTTDSDKVIISSKLESLDGKSRQVTVIGKGALNGQKVGEVTIPESVGKVEEQGLANAGIRVLRIQGKIEKGMFGKNALKGNGTGKKGKGMEILVDSRKDAKALKNQLKKAGAGKANVSVQK